MPVPPQFTTSTVWTAQLHTVTACPPSVRDCPASDKTTYYTTKTVAAYTTVCPITAEEVATANMAPGSIAKGQPTGSPSEKRTTSTVFTTQVHTVTACPLSVKNCPASEQITYYTTETVAAYTTVCPVTAEEDVAATTTTITAAEEQPTESPNELLTTSTVYTTYTHYNIVCPSSMQNCAASQMIASMTTETVVAYATVCPVAEAESGRETGTMAAPTSPISHDEYAVTTGTLVTLGTNTATITATHSTHEGSIIEDTTTYLITTTIPVGPVLATESASASSSAFDNYQPAGTYNSAVDEFEGKSVGSKDNISGYVSGGTRVHPSLKTSHAIAASPSALSYSVNGVARSGTSTDISPSSSASTVHTAVYKGAASKPNALSVLPFLMVVIASYLVL